MQQEIVLVTGASGFIGSYLIPFLLQHNYQVLALSRNKHNQQTEHVTWMSDFSEIQSPKIDYVINLAGENIGKSRWTKQRKQQLIASRVNTTTALYNYLEQQHIRPKCILNGSAIGYYGIDGTEQWQQICDETSSAQAIFMSQLCQQWEAVAQNYPQQNSKTLRLGVVLAAKGGILAQMLTPIRFNLIQNIGTGLQPFVWVHIADVLAVMHLIMQNQPSQDVFNLVAPSQNTQADFARLAAQQLNKKPWLNLPKAVLQCVLGEQSQLVLNGQYVQPQVLLKAGYQFKFPTLAAALQDLLSD